ncbi:MAG: tyrosine-type recombinase/integrase [Vulcanimicrobiota bacterium]
MKGVRPNTLAKAVRTFFSEHMPFTRGLSTHTVQSYRDAFKSLLCYLANSRGCNVVDLDFIDVTPESVIAFLEHLETDCGNGASTRNARLAAVRSFAAFVATLYPEYLEQCQRLLAIPTKRTHSQPVEYLEGYEIRVILDSINRNTLQGLRDYALVYTLFNTGARVQELLDVRPVDIQFECPHQVILRGKGRKERICPLWQHTVDLLRILQKEIGLCESSTERLFRNRRGEPLTRFGVRYLLRKYAKIGQASAATLTRKKVHPHTFRHSAAVHMLQAGVDLSSICDWLGHARLETTNRYAKIDLDAKRAAIAKAGPIVEGSESVCAWRKDESLLAWLESL